MATPSGSDPTPTLARTNSVADAGQCWICYLDASETPNQRWVNACPCTLEAHEKCLLEWITREEHEGRLKDGALKCPQCKATIRTEEPYDAVYALRNALRRAYSNATPYILALTFTTGSVAGSAWYGYNAFAIFAGQEEATRWVMGRSSELLDPEVLFKLLGLAQVGPGLVLGRLIPRLNLLVLPFTTLYAASLMHRDPFTTWPPSPEWVITMIPSLHITYCALWKRLFGSLERRINKTLRGGNLDSLDAGGDPPVQPDAVAPEPPARREPGLLANAMDMVNAVTGLFQVEGNAEEGGLEFEVRIEGAFGDEEDEVEADNDNVVVVERDQPPEPAAADAAAAPPPPAVPPPPAAQRPAQGAAPQNNNNNNQNQNRRDRQNNDVVWPSLTDILNNVATSLILPAISWVMGECIRRAITGPSITTGLSSGLFGRRRISSVPTGLLQHRWGRSLVGGCLFVVLKDALILYAKYRGAEAKKNRRIKEVPKRNRNTTSTTGATTPSTGGTTSGTTR